ncbi:MAG: dienelactone hydrolase family protein [Chloroflexi bacterium]|nr:dienelactone hydrolase family protein [Chloroflexota bacterium]
MKPKVLPEPYLVVPKSGKGSGVLVIHAWWGLNEFFRSVCDRLAREGFVAMAPDLYEGQVAKSIKRAEELRDKPRREPTYKTLLRAIENLQAMPEVKGPSIGIIGFSMGGHWALWLAANRPALPIRGVTTFYGARSGDYSKSRAAFQGHFAEEDAWVSDASRRKLERTLEAAGRKVDFHVYPGTSHWFFEADREDAYDPRAAKLAWDRTLAFLRANLKS